MLDRRNAARGSVKLDRDTYEALRAFARGRGWTMERAATAIIQAAMIEHEIEIADHIADALGEARS